MSLSKKILFTSSAALISIAGGLVRNKIFAAYLSINLFGILSIGQQAMSLLFTFIAFGLPLGITTFASELLRKSKHEQRENISRLAVLIALLAGGFLVLLSVILLIDPYYVSKLITNRTEYALPISLILLSAPLMVVENCLFSIMEGMGNLKGIIYFKIIPMMLVLPAMFLLVSEYMLTGAAVGMVVNELLLIGVALYLLRDQINISLASWKVSTVFFPVFKVASLSLLAGVGWMVTDFFVKRSLLGLLGETSNAIVQSVAKIVDLYPSIALSWLTMHIFPLVSLKREDTNAVIGTIQRTVVIAVSIIIPIIFILFTLRELILQILYTADFVVAVDYFGAMLVTGIPKVYGGVLGAALLPLGFKREWFYSIVVGIIAYGLGVYWGIGSQMAVYAIPFAHGISLSAQTVYMLFVFQRHGICFDKQFTFHSFIFFVMTILIIAALYWSWIIVVVGLVFIFFLIRYGMIKEILQKFYDIRDKNSP